MKRTLPILLTLVLAASASAQNTLSYISSALASTRVEFDYAYSVVSSVDIKGTGHVSLQGDKFHMSGEGLETVCDGLVRWTVDKAAKECYIESVDSSSPDYEANPALLIASLDKAFDLKGTRQASFHGKGVTAMDLEPKSSGAFSAVTVYVSGSVPAGAALTMQDGTVTEIVVSGWKTAAPADAKTAYTFDVGTLGSDYLVTDLR